MDALGMRLRGKAAASDRNGCFELYPSVSQLHCHEWATTVGELIFLLSSHHLIIIRVSSAAHHNHQQLYFN